MRNVPIIILIIMCGCVKSEAPLELVSSQEVVASADHEYISISKLQELVASGDDFLLLDVRSRKEYSTGHISGAVLKHYQEVMARPHEISPDKDRMIVVYCATGGRTRMARKALLKAGYENVYHLKGDMRGWRAKGLPVTSM